MASQESQFDAFVLEADPDETQGESQVQNDQEAGDDFQWRAQGGFLHCSNGPSSLAPEIVRQLFSSPNFGAAGAQVAEEFIQNMLPKNTGVPEPPVVEEKLSRGKSSMALEGPGPDNASSSSDTMEMGEWKKNEKKRENRQRQKANKKLQKKGKWAPSQYPESASQPPVFNFDSLDNFILLLTSRLTPLTFAIGAEKSEPS